MLGSAGKAIAHGREGPTDGAVDGWRLLLALVAWVALSAAAGVASWNALDALAPGWGGIDERVLVVVAEVYFALVVALLLAFGGPVGVRHLLRFRYTSASNLRLALGCGCFVLGRHRAHVRGARARAGTSPVARLLSTTCTSMWLQDPVRVTMSWQYFVS